MNGLLYYSFTPESGYGRSALAYLEYLIQTGLSVRWEPLIEQDNVRHRWSDLEPSQRPVLNLTSANSESLLNTLGAEIDYDTVLIHSVPEMFSALREEGKRNLGYFAWETDAIPLSWPPMLEAMDELIVPSTFSAATVEKAVSTPVSVVPHMFEWSNADIQNAKGKQLRRGLNIADSTFVFYTIDEWVPRKALNNTIRCFLNTFSKDDDVCFVVKTSIVGLDLDSEQVDRLMPSHDIVAKIIDEYENPARVILLNRFMNEEGMHALHDLGQCYVSMTHGEGWGLNAFNAAHFANSVVITGWGGQLDFLDGDSADLIDYTLKPVIEYLGWESYARPQNWAVADSSHASNLLKLAVQNPQLVAQKGQALQAFVQKHFAKTRIGPSLMRVLSSQS